MFSLNSSLFFFYNNNNYFFNYFFFKNYNYIIIFYILHMRNIRIKKNFLLKNNKNYKNSLCNKTNLFIKTKKYFNYFVLNVNNLNKNLIQYIHIEKNFSFFIFNNLIIKSLKRFNDLIFQLTLNGKNFLILGYEHSYLSFIYNYIFHFKTVKLYSMFFFVKPIVFTNIMWINLYKQFLKDNNIELLIIFNYDYFSNYIKNFYNLNICVSSLLPLNFQNDYIDYTLYLSNFNSKLEKFIYFILISEVFFYSSNIRYLNLKLNFFKNFSILHNYFLNLIK